MYHDTINKLATTIVSKMATWKRWMLPQWFICLHGQEGDYNSVLDGYMDKMKTTTMAKMATKT